PSRDRTRRSLRGAREDRACPFLLRHRVRRFAWRPVKAYSALLSSTTYSRSASRSVQLEVVEARGGRARDLTLLVVRHPGQDALEHLARAGKGRFRVRVV